MVSQLCVKLLDSGQLVIIPPKVDNRELLPGDTVLSNEHCNIRINLVVSFDGWLKDKNSGIYIFLVIYLLVFFNTCRSFIVVAKSPARS